VFDPDQDSFDRGDSFLSGKEFGGSVTAQDLQRRRKPMCSLYSSPNTATACAITGTMRTTTLGEVIVPFYSERGAGCRDVFLITDDVLLHLAKRNPRLHLRVKNTALR
jgi:hypothetical protein